MTNKDKIAKLISCLEVNSMNWNNIKKWINKSMI